MYVLLCGGCGAPGDPLPPLLNIPAATTDLAALQRGGQILLRWTTPAATTEGTSIKDLDRVELLGMGVEGDSVDAAALEAESRVLLTLDTPKPGEAIERSLALPVEPGRRFAFAVKNLNRRGRSAGVSNVVVVQVVEAPKAPAGLRAVGQPDAIRLEWSPARGATGYQIYRRQGETAEFALVATVDAPPFHDRDFQWKVPLQYFVRTLVKTATGHAESLDSQQASILPEDTFAPSTPAGLRAVTAEAAVDLSWNLSPEADTTGYNVYRDGTKLNATLLSAPAFHDDKIESNRQYSYSVSAVDDKGNESAPSASVRVMIP